MISIGNYWKKAEPIKNIINIGEVKYKKILELLNNNYVVVHPSKLKALD